MTTLRAVAAVTCFISSGAFAGDPDVSGLYAIDTAGTTATVKAGASGTLAIEVKAKGDAHISDEAPLKLDVTSASLTFAKSKFTRADSTTQPTASVKYPNPKFAVAFTANTAGAATAEADLTFFVCTENLCARQKKKIVVPITVQ